MNPTYSLPAIAERIQRSGTMGARPDLESEVQRKFPGETVLSEPNRDTADRTDVSRVNGTSNSLRIQLGQILLSPPMLPKAREYFLAMQRWEGHVIDVGHDTFRARLVPIIGEGSDQEAEIYTQEVAADDRSLIELGAVFYWSIGYLDKPSGRLRASIIRFRRLPVWSKRELENADAKADKLRGLLDVP